jgi:transcriptional regulator with XRE-family HTH domain
MVALPFCHVTLRGQKPKSAKYPKAVVTAGDHLRKRRLDLGLEQRVVASILQVGTSSVINWELGRRPVDVAAYPKLIEFLGYNPLPEALTPGQAVARHRISRGLSRKSLARLAGVDEATVGRLESDTPRMAKRPVSIVRKYLGLESTDSIGF